MRGEIPEKKKIYLAIAVVSVAFMFAMIAFCNIRSLWMDDLAQIKIISVSSLSALLKNNMMIDNNPPVSHLLSYFWLNIVPYGTGWLKLMNIILTAIGVFTCGVVAYELWGKWAGIGTAFLGASNMAIVTLGAYTFRPYGLLFLLSALMIWSYVRSRRILNWKTNILFMTIQLLAVYTHYFAVLICVILFFCDILLILRKKLRVVSLLVYPVVAFAFLPWLICVFRNSVDRLKNFWPEKPDLVMLKRVLEELAGGDKSFVLLMSICCVFFGLKLIFQLHKGKENLKNIFFSLVMLVIPIVVIGSVYLASRYMKSITSLFVSRYFICVMPQILILSGIGMGALIEFILFFFKSEAVKKGACFCLILFLICLVGKNGYNIYQNEQIMWEPFEETADFLQEQENIRNPETLVFNTCYGLQEGWDYYLTHHGVREGIDVIWYNLSEENLDGITCVYVVTLHLQMRQEDSDLLNENGFVLVEQNAALPIQIYERK